MIRLPRTALVALSSIVALAGCSTAPTITVPNPLAAFDGLFPAPRVATAPAPSAAPVPALAYERVAPVFQDAGPVAYDVPAPAYGPLGASLPSVAPPLDGGLYEVGPVDIAASSPIYEPGFYAEPVVAVRADSVPTLGVPFAEPLDTARVLGAEETVAPSLVEAVGTTYDLTGSVSAVPIPGPDPVPSMGGSFQVVPPVPTAPPFGGIETYRAPDNAL